jgi:membrane protein required for colicin V production
MNWLDIVILVILVITVFLGLKAGLIKMVISLAGLILGIFMAGRLYQALADKLSVMIVAAIVAWLLTKLISAITLGWVNRLGGALVGLLIAAIFIGAILAVWAKYGGGSNIIAHAWLGKLLVDKFPLVLGLLPPEFDSVHTFFK